MFCCCAPFILVMVMGIFEDGRGECVDNGVGAVVDDDDDDDDCYDDDADGGDENDEDHENDEDDDDDECPGNSA